MRLLWAKNASLGQAHPQKQLAVKVLTSSHATTGSTLHHKLVIFISQIQDIYMAYMYMYVCRIAKWNYQSGIKTGCIIVLAAISILLLEFASSDTRW